MTLLKIEVFPEVLLTLYQYWCGCRLCFSHVLSCLPNARCLLSTSEPSGPVVKFTVNRGGCRPDDLVRMGKRVYQASEPGSFCAFTDPMDFSPPPSTLQWRRNA